MTRVLVALVLASCGAAPMAPSSDRWVLRAERTPPVGYRFHVLAISEATIAGSGTIANQPLPERLETERALLEGDAEVVLADHHAGTTVVRLVIARLLDGEAPLLSPGSIVEERHGGGATTLHCNGAPCDAEVAEALDDLLPSVSGTDGGRDTMVFGETPRAVGDTWHPDVERLLASVGPDRGFTLDASRTSGFVTLRAHGLRGDVPGSTVAGELRSTGVGFPLEGRFRESSLDAQFQSFVPDDARHPILFERMELHGRFVVEMSTPVGPALATVVATTRRTTEIDPR